MDRFDLLTTSDADVGLPASPCLRFSKDRTLLILSTNDNGIKVLANGEGVRILRPIENRMVDTSRAASMAAASVKVQPSIPSIYGVMDVVAGSSIGDRTASVTAVGNKDLAVTAELPAYFGFSSPSDVPDLVETVDDPKILFSSISVLNEQTDTIHIEWAAYPQYHPPEVFSKFVLDDIHLYYANAFESGASTMESSTVSGENMAQLILSRLSSEEAVDSESILNYSIDDGKVQESQLSNL